MQLPAEVPTNPFPIAEMYHGSRLEPKGFAHIHHMFLPRPTQSLAAIWRRANGEEDTRLRSMLLFFAEQAIWGMSVLARYAPTHYSQVNQYLNGVYYVGSQIVDVSPWYILDGKLSRMAKAFDPLPLAQTGAAVTTGDCASIAIPDDSIDYVFTDPPFGENIYYADLNFLVESWHRVLTDSGPEAIIDRAKKKRTIDYQNLMRSCFEEYHRVLKPGRWMTVVFSNSRNQIWRAIQEAMGTAGFVVADVRTLDKKQGSYRQVTSSAVKQDLVISAYKPTKALTEQFALGTATVDGVWNFVAEHLRNVPLLVGQGGDGEVVAERTPQMLHDRTIAFCVRRHLAVPISGPEFFAGLEKRFPERHGMHLLPEQVAAYDRQRHSVRELRQLTLFITDESTATQWVRQQLALRPRTLQDLTPQFIKEIQNWAKHEQTVELREILRLNFFHYDGHGPVPGQIRSYLRKNFRDCRNLDEEDRHLREKAADRWYVPDPSKVGDLEKLRMKTLLEEFESYRASEQRKIKQFRTEAVRAGFKHGYDEQDYATIVAVAAKLPEEVIQEDETLLMYYDVATMRLGED